MPYRCSRPSNTFRLSYLLSDIVHSLFRLRPANLYGAAYNIQAAPGLNTDMSFQFPKLIPKSFTNTSQEPGWRPSYLRKRILILFVLIFSAIIAALEVLYQSSAAHNGIAASTQDRHYLWTYGPTAILTIVTTLWSRVEFQTKQSAPWQALYESPQPAEKSVLLDYVSDMQPVAIWRALKNKHFAVASAASCSLLLRLLIIFSTGLFSLNEVPVQKNNVPIQVHDRFSAQSSTLATAGSQPYDILNGILFKNLTYPIGTTKNITFQEFSAPQLPSNAVVTAPIDGLMADLDCEPASIDETTMHYLWSNQSAYASKTFHFHISSPSCKITNTTLISNGQGQMAEFSKGKCENSDAPDGTRIVLTLVDAYRKSRTDAKPPANHLHDNSSWETIHLGLNKAKCFICKPILSLVKLQAEVNATQVSSSVRLQKIGSKNSNIPGITATDIAEIILNSNTTLSTGFRPAEDLSPLNVSSGVNLEYVLGMYLIGVQNTLPNLWQGDVLHDSATAYYRAIAAQFMHMGLAQKRQSTIIGSAIINENRVVMMQSSLRGMEVCLALGILLAISMLLYLPRSPISTWNPNYISGIAAITANSDGFRSSLYGTGVMTTKTLQYRLIGKQYHSQSTPKGTSIEISEDGRRESRFDPQFGTEYREWKPFPALIGRIIIFVLVLSAIAVLEILLHISQARNGLGDASSTNEYMHYLWTIVPALIMVGISLLFSSIDFNIRCLAPYAPLNRHKGAIFERTMDLSFLDSLGLINSIRSITLRHFAVQATTLATSAALFLTIVTSGLYSVIDVPFHTDLNFTRVGGFPDPRTIAGPKLNMDEIGEVAGILTSEYILQYNLSFPHWTHEELALAEITMDQISDTFVNGSFVDIQVPALRPAPLCQLQTAADMSAQINYYEEDGGYHLYVNQSRLGCPGNNTNYYWNHSVLSVEKLEPEPFGYSSQSECYSDPTSKGVFDGVSHYATSYVWGYLNTSSIQHIMGMSCLQYVETVDVQTRFLLPTLDIDPETPPVPDESSAKLLPNLYTPIPEWWVLNPKGHYPKLDGFFQILTSGKYAIPIEIFESAEHDKTVIEAIKHQYRIINAQQISNYTRGTANDSIEHAPLLGNVTASNHLRVVQDVTSTRLLEGLLAVILALGIFGSVLLNTDHVLPKNPCSIAAVASLLADSNLLNEFTQGVWDPTDKQPGKTFVCRLFHLGWWENDNPENNETNKRLFTIDHLSAEKETH